MNHLTPASSVINVPDDEPLVVVTSHASAIQKRGEETGDWFDIRATVNLSQGDGALSLTFAAIGDPANAEDLSGVEEGISAFDTFLAALHAARNRFVANVRDAEETFGIA